MSPRELSVVGSNPTRVISLMTVSAELCCVALPFCCIVVVLPCMPFSASLKVIVLAQHIKLDLEFENFPKHM